MVRRLYTWLGGLVGLVFGVWSLHKAIFADSTFRSYTHQQLGNYLVGFWVLAPPIFFWIDWVLFCRGMDEKEQEVVIHTHDLSRNIWLALIAILTVLFNIKLVNPG